MSHSLRYRIGDRVVGLRSKVFYSGTRTQENASSEKVVNNGFLLALLVVGFGLMGALIGVAGFGVLLLLVLVLPLHGVLRLIGRKGFAFNWTGRVPTLKRWWHDAFQKRRP